MKSDARYTISVEIESDNEGEAIFDRKLFLSHLRRMLDTYTHIGSINITLYWIGEDTDEGATINDRRGKCERCGRDIDGIGLCDRCAGIMDEEEME